MSKGSDYEPRTIFASGVPEGSGGPQKQDQAVTPEGSGGPQSQDQPVTEETTSESESSSADGPEAKETVSCN